jgi:hypothetical protein
MADAMALQDVVYRYNPKATGESVRSAVGAKRTSESATLLESSGSHSRNATTFGGL